MRKFVVVLVVLTLLFSIPIITSSAKTNRNNKKNNDSIIVIPVYRDYDINMDGKIDGLDVSLVSSAYTSEGEPGWIREDINDDGKVNYLDVSILVSHYGEEYDPIPIGPVDKIKDLIKKIKDLDLDKRFEKRLINRLENAIKHLNKNKVIQTIVKLNQFIRDVKRIRNLLPTGLADELIIDAENIINLLQ